MADKENKSTEYRIHIARAEGVSIGDRAQISQEIGSQEDLQYCSPTLPPHPSYSPPGERGLAPMNLSASDAARTCPSTSGKVESCEVIRPGGNCVSQN
jgi:hypothetical protein